MACDPLTVDPEFAALCGRLSPEERSLLESQLERDGCLDPIILWANHDQTIIDGHHRYEICGQLRIKFTTKALRFDSREEVIEWIACHQLGRRNASDEVKDYLRGKRYHAEKKSEGAPEGNANRAKQRAQNEPVERTAERLASEYNVSPATIKRDAQFAEAVDALAGVSGPEVKAKILSGESGLTKKDVVAVASLPPREQKLALKAVANGQSVALPAASVPISDTFYKSLKGLVERIEGIREQYGTVKAMFDSPLWEKCDTQFVIELVRGLSRMFRELDKEMQQYVNKKKTANGQLRKANRRRSKAFAR